jgi:hypothetical protein
MSARESDFARKITAYLDHGTAELKAGVAYRLQQARAEALARLAAEPERAPVAQPVYALAGPGGTGGRRGGARGMRWVVGVIVFAVVAGLGWQQWQAVQQARELAEIDAQLLVSDLPIDAYLDRGFQNWLKATSFER